MLMALEGDSVKTKVKKIVFATEGTGETLPADESTTMEGDANDAQADAGGNSEQTTTEGETITLVDLHAVASDIIHYQLFGSFLVCGTIIGVAILWRVLK